MYAVVFMQQIQILLFGTSFPNISHLQLVEPMDVEPVDMEG